MKVILATGGTAGHVFPAWEVARELRRQGHEVFIVGAIQRFADKIQQEGFRTVALELKGFRLSSWSQSWQATTSLGRAFPKVIKLVEKIHPDAVCGFGGYGAFPTVAVAILQKIPTLIHEQNLIPGKANRLLGRGARKIAISFGETAKYFPKEKTVWTGCPCREVPQTVSPQQARKKLGLKPDCYTLLVLGGSQGSQRINLEACAAVNELKRDGDLQVLHLSGSVEVDRVRAYYEAQGILAVVHGFFDDMEIAYRAADMAVCRSGALTVTELAKFALPAVLIPYPFAGGHQKFNAQVLERIGLASILEEQKLDDGALLKSLAGLKSRIAQSPPQIAPNDLMKTNGTQLVVQEILNIK